MPEDVKIPVDSETESHSPDSPDISDTHVTEETEHGVSITTEPTDEEKPEWLPEKFDSPEALAEAYRNLEQKLGDDGPEKLDTIETPEAGNIDQTKLEPFAKEYFETGELSENSFNQLEGMGLNREIVNAFIDGQRAQHQQEVSKIYDVAGGQQNYTDTLAWAGENLSEAEIETYNKTVESGDYEAASTAVKGLQARHHQAAGTPPQLLKSEPQGPGGPTPYESIAQMTKDMESREYKTDPAFRKKVENRLAISDIMG